jgi:hypothetical protein
MPSTRVEILRGATDIARRLDFWRACSPRRDADPGFFQSIVDGIPGSRPHVFVVLRDERPIAMLVARHETARLDLRVGYHRLPTPRMRMITVVHGGALGEFDDEATAALIEALRGALRGGEADALKLHGMDTAHRLARGALADTSWFVRGRAVGQPHHWLDLGKIAPPYLGSLSSNERTHHKRRKRALLKAYNGQVEITRVQHPGEVGGLVATAESIARNSYQRSIGVGFFANDSVVGRLEFEARQGWLRAFVLRLGGVPRAFWIGSILNGVFLSEYMAFDPSHGAHSPGMYLVMETIESFCDAPSGKACEHIDFGTGDAGWKKRLGNQSFEEADIWLFAPTIRGVFANLLRAVATGLNDSAKRLLAEWNLAESIKKRLRG